jgi:outer membrane protein W
MNDSLTIVAYLKKKYWFSRAYLYFDATAQNPYTTIKGLTGIKVKDDTMEKWGIGVTVGYGANSNGLSPFVGIGLQRNFIRF